ncbi:MAG: VIT domain-containing protein [Phycisphaerae bacterium]|nr:VIT domain-containing protein [Phycisphaerae bacterium]
MKKLTGAMAVTVMLLVAGSALGQGMMVPSGPDRTLPPLAIKSQQVEIGIKDQVATTTVKQVFINSTNRQLEANYVFPLPPDATIRDFSMIVDGKMKKGEVVEAVKAKQIYQQIVAQSRDPGLLEHLGDNLFRLNIFPVPANGTQSTEITYSQVIAGNNGLFRYTYPLHTAGKASAVQDFFSIGAKLASKVAIKTIYSPTHDIGVSRKGEHEATVGLEQNKALLDKDFSLYWTISEKDFGLNAIAYRPNADEPGYLMLMISPKSAVNEKEVIAKDVIFVFDTSGSMQGAKIEQAKKALKFCVESLNEKDRFNILTFNTDVTPYKDELIDASKANKEAVRDFINRLNAEGGTNIHDALGKALEIVKKGEEGKRPHVIVFLTDGRPTIGKTGTEEILGVLRAKDVASGESLQKLQERKRELESAFPLRSVEPLNDPAYREGRAMIVAVGLQMAELDKGTARIFTFGVGDDVNTKLLDQVAGKTGGQPEYVRGGEDIEVKVSDFFAKASHPVMTGLKLAFGGKVKIDGMLPAALPDLYFGQQVIAFARYDGSGDIAVTLSGTVSDGSTEKPTYEVTLPKQTTENDFIEPLWAHRKVGYLLDQIRLNGESKELKDEVIRLSTKYRIQTPYTSYLVLEDQHKRQYLPDVANAGGGGYGYDRGGRESWRQQGQSPADRPSGPALAPPTSKTTVAPAEPVLPSVTPGIRVPSGTGETPAGDKNVATGVATRSDPAKVKADLEQSKELEKLAKLMDDADKAGHSGDGREGKDGYFDGKASGAWASSPATTQPDNGLSRFDERSLRDESGATAVGLAKAIDRMKKAEGDYRRANVAERKAAGRTFYQVSGFWIDEKFAAPTKLTFVKWGSEAYFAIVAGHVELKDAFALGTRLIVTTAEGKALVVSDSEGAETMTEKEVKELFAAGKK